MTISLTRRQLAQAALAGAAATLLPEAAPAQNTEPAMPATTSPGEADALTHAVPFNVGYVLSETQVKEVAGALKDYPGAFAKARAYAIPDDIAPAWAGSSPPARPGRGRG